MKKIIFKTRLLVFSGFFVLILSVGCDRRKELDANFPAFPPKLSITAILDSETGSLYISLMEARSLADYAGGRPFYYFQQKIHDGEIRLFEDGTQILSIQGPFDTSTPSVNRLPIIQNVDYILMPGITVNPGSVYRFEAEIEGYPAAVSTATAPVAPVVTASMDTSVQVINSGTIESVSMGYVNELFSAWNGTMPDKYWPVSVHVTDPDPDNVNYYTLDVFKTERIFIDNTLLEVNNYNWGIGAYASTVNSNLIELLNDMGFNFFYLFSMLLTNDIDFSYEDLTSRTYYTGVVEIPNYPNDEESSFDVEKITTHHSLSLRVTHIPSEVYRYYNSLEPNKAIGLLSEAINVFGNIENGYGVFSVLNSTRVNLLEWETHEWRGNKEE